MGRACLTFRRILGLVLRFALRRDDFEGDHLVFDGLLLSRYLHNQLGRLRHLLSVRMDGTQLLVPRGQDYLLDVRVVGIKILVVGVVS